MAETATEKSEIEKESKDAEISTTPPNIVTVSEETEKTVGFFFYFPLFLKIFYMNYSN